MAYLSFNQNLGDALQFSKNDDAGDDAIAQKEMPLKYTFVLWEQIMQASDGKAAQ
jgi:hypothetical protein